jgi:RNA polymerase sigma factor (sigma-70 family)
MKGLFIAMSAVYHTTTIFQPTIQASREQFDARISVLGKRLEEYVRSRVYYLCVHPDDIEDAIQGALIRLWTIYQRQPWVMDLGDGWWLKVARRAAQNTLRRQIAQRGKKTANGVHRLEYNATSLETDDIDLDGLELVEVKRFHRDHRVLRIESDQADRRIDAERLVEEALKPLTYRQREALRLLIPLVAEGYPLLEAARHAAIDRTRAQRAWKAFRHVCEELSGQVRDQLKGKGTRATTEELEHIRLLAELGLSCTVIAQQIGRNKNFVKEHFEKATGYRRGSTNQRNPITPQRVVQMKTLRTQGLSIASIARQVGCSVGSVCHWLQQ